VDNLNGVSASLLYTIGLGGTYRGLVASFMAAVAKKVEGVMISTFTFSKEHKGMALGGINYTKKLKGVQIGLLNYAGNNPKGLRLLPLINMHLGKK
jgi:hypothetical protein